MIYLIISGAGCGKRAFINRTINTEWATKPISIVCEEGGGYCMGYTTVSSYNNLNKVVHHRMKAYPQSVLVIDCGNLIHTSDITRSVVDNIDRFLQGIRGYDNLVDVYVCLQHSDSTKEPTIIPWDDSWSVRKELV